MNKNKVFCNNCQNTTWHQILCERKFADEEVGVFAHYFFLECRGCESIKMQALDYDGTGGTDDEGNELPYERIYPSKALRTKPKWLGQLVLPYTAGTGFSNKNLLMLLIEIYTALHSNCRRLAMMGVRSLLEHIMIQKCGDNGSFARNLTAFKNAGFVSEHQKEALEAVLEAGHATMHRSHAPSEKQILAALDITENVIHSIYILERTKAVSIKDVPPRPSKKL